MTPRESAIAEAGRIFAAAARERDELAATRGTRAVAEAAHYPGHPLTVGEIEARYRAMQDRARRKAAA